MTDITPLPWRKAFTGRDNKYVIQTASEPSQPIAITLGDNALARGSQLHNAQYIAMACNAHPALVDALKRVTALAIRLIGPEAAYYEVTDARMALAHSNETVGDETARQAEDLLDDVAAATQALNELVSRARATV